MRNYISLDQGENIICMLVADMLIFFLKGLLTCLLSYENCYDYIFMDVVRSQFTTDKQLSDLSVW